MMGRREQDRREMQVRNYFSAGHHIVDMESFADQTTLWMIAAMGAMYVCVNFSRKNFIDCCPANS